MLSRIAGITCGTHILTNTKQQALMLLVWVYLRGLVPILSSLTVPSERREANAEGEKKRREAVADDPNLRNYRLEYYTQDLAAVEKE